MSTADTETDFFLNAAHLQLHRRARAINRLGKLAEGLAAAAAVAGTADGAPPQLTAEEQAKLGSLRLVVDVAVPLLQVVISEGGDGALGAREGGGAETVGGEGGGGGQSGKGRKGLGRMHWGRAL